MKLLGQILGQSIAACVLMCVSNLAYSQTSDLKTIQIYSQDELIELINKNQHLTRVKLDNCQLVQDIEARAVVMKVPAYQFLYGDMLAYAVCVKRDVELGVYYMREAANQGLDAALEQLGRYYHTGRLVEADLNKAIIYLTEAASLGNLNAQIRLVDMYNAGQGSPQDFEDAYRWLNNAKIDDKQLRNTVKQKLALLAQKMPPSVVARAKR
jgi:hypothetical protein